MKSRKETILDCIREIPKSKDDIAKELGLKPLSINRPLLSLCKEKKVATIKTSRFRWNLYKAIN